MRLLLAAIGIVVAAVSGTSGGVVQTVYQGSGPIAAFAQDDSVLAWVAAGGRSRCNAVHLLSAAGANTTLPKTASDNVTCRWSIGGGPVRLAIAAQAGDTAALWTLHQTAQVSLDYVVGATARHQAERRFAQVTHNNAGAGLWFGGIAGSSSTLVYATTEVAYVDQVDCLSGGSCALKVAGGAIHRVVGRADQPLPDTGPAVDLAVAAGRIADIPAAAVGPGGLPQAADGGSVQVRDGTTGTIVSEVAPDGVAQGIALAPHVLAVLARTGAKTTISWYDPDTARLLGIEKVPPQTSADIAANDTVVVFRVGRAIRAIDVGTGTIRALATAAATPIGLSLDDGRLAWAENVKGVGRVRTLQLG